MESWTRMLRTMRATFATMGRHAGRWIERDGVGALVMPSVPERSIVNSVTYAPDADVAAAYGALESHYAEVDAWTVWVPDHDRATAEFLEARGHVLDASPAAMVADLATIRAPERPPAWERATPEQIGHVNNVAYGMEGDSLERAFREASAGEGFHLYVAADACVLGIHDCDGDAGVFFVATLPEARGRGLAGALLAIALLEARERGCDISTLQATKAGAPVYGRLGYETFGSIEMWEKRA
jgi:GNAT superfamily N-acetyltransferase